MNNSKISGGRPVRVLEFDQQRGLRWHTEDYEAPIMPLAHKLPKVFGSIVERLEK